MSLIVRQLDALAEHVLVHTGQNHAIELSDLFFSEFRLRSPDIHLGIDGQSFGEQLAQISTRIGPVLDRINPDRLLVLGDTNSGLSALVAARRGIPVYHLEAGNRSYDMRIPEEFNRRVIDHASTVLMPYTERSKENLLREGFRRDRIFVTGNPISEVIAAATSRIEASDVLTRLTLSRRQYLLATLHRAENVDDPVRLQSLFLGLEKVARSLQMRVIVSVHPRTANRLARLQFHIDDTRITLMKPFGFADFVRLERDAVAVLSDSGTVQEECVLLGVPNVVLRDVTERAETMEIGASVLSGCDPDDILRATAVATSAAAAWVAPPEYTRENVSATVARIVLSYRYAGALI